MRYEFIQEYNGRALRVWVPADLDRDPFRHLPADPDDRDFVAFAREHSNSDLVVLPAGRGRCLGGPAVEFFVIRKKFKQAAPPSASSGSLFAQLVRTAIFLFFLLGALLWFDGAVTEHNRMYGSIGCRHHRDAGARRRAARVFRARVRLVLG